MFSLHKYQSILLLWIFLTIPTAIVQAQASVVSVKALSDDGDFGWEGLVCDNMALYNTELRSLLHQLRTAQEKSAMTESAQSANSSLDGSNKALIDLEKARKMGAISESDYQKMRKEVLQRVQQLKDMQQSAAEAPSIHNATALKEQIRLYCLGQRFYRRICHSVNGVRLVEVGANKGGRHYEACGFIDEQGNVIVEPRYLDFSNGMQHRDCRFSFNKLDLIVAFNGWTSETHRACVINRMGNVIIPPEYYWLEFFNDCPLLRACQTSGGKWGIIDLKGNLLEPFVHNGKYDQSLDNAKKRIMKEKNITPSRIF